MRRILAIRGIRSPVPTFLDPAVSSLPEPDLESAARWRGGPGVVALSEWSAAGIALACMVVEALRLGGVVHARLDPEGWPAPGLVDSLALCRGLVAEHPGSAVFLRGLSKLAAIAAIGDLVVEPAPRTCVALGLAELDKGPHSPGLASAMTAAMLFSGGLRAADLRRLAERIELGGLTGLRLLGETRPPEARELGARLARLRDPRPPAWEALPSGCYELEVEALTRDL
ncbi:MAG TPA: hypothetical protein QGF58_07035, partial [Myxococcota bacterium]|nr:hypothetical protein [Myxococcota bacterium]